MSRASTYGLDPGPVDGLEWYARGACRNYDPDLWTSPDAAERGQARWVCLHRCDVREQCLAWAERHTDLIGGAVYGGYHWARDGRSERGPVRIGGNQPTPQRPTGQPARRRPEKHQQPQVRLLPHLDEIRALYAADVPTIDIARRYGCSDDAIRSFAWRHGICRPARAT